MQQFGPLFLQSSSIPQSSSIARKRAKRARKPLTTSLQFFSGVRVSVVFNAGLLALYLLFLALSFRLLFLALSFRLLFLALYLLFLALSFRLLFLALYLLFLALYLLFLALSFRLLFWQLLRPFFREFLVPFLFLFIRGPVKLSFSCKLGPTFRGIICTLYFTTFMVPIGLI
jgi:hypothetical protein